jgi:hypothetical protein
MANVIAGRSHGRYISRVMSNVFPIDTRRLMVQIHDFDLTVGDILRVGDSVITVIDIDNGEVTFRIDEGEIHDDPRINDPAEVALISIPR